MYEAIYEICLFDTHIMLFLELSNSMLTFTLVLKLLKAVCIPNSIVGPILMKLDLI